MNFMTILYSTFAIVSFILFSIKFFIHALLDYKNGYKVKYSPFLSIEYILIYDKSVKTEFNNLKEICNKIHKAAIITFFLTLILLFLKEFL